MSEAQIVPAERGWYAAFAEPGEGATCAASTYFESVSNATAKLDQHLRIRADGRGVLEQIAPPRLADLLALASLRSDALAALARELVSGEG